MSENNEVLQQIIKKIILSVIIIIGLFYFILPVNAQECDSLELQHLRDSCWFDLAEETGNIDSCDNIKDENFSNGCMSMVASKYPSVGNCSKLEGPISRDGCFSQVYASQAEQENNISLCEKAILEYNFRDYCYKAALQNKNSLCDQVIEEDLNQAGKEFCYKLWANERVDTQYCNYVKGSECYYDIFKLPGGITTENCKSIDHENARNSCFSKLSKMNNSPYYCLYNKGFARTDCLNDFPIVGIIGSIIYAVIVLVMIVLYIWLKRLFKEDKIKNKTVFKGIIRGLIHAIPGYILFVLSSYFSFYSYWIGGVRGEDGMGVGILMVTILWPISLIITIILFIRGVLWKK